ncbi:hypothetical protein Hanom_Chr14g01324421 [Helianthus anomalus]
MFFLFIFFVFNVFHFFIFLFFFLLFLFFFLLFFFLYFFLNFFLFFFFNFLLDFFIFNLLLDIPVKVHLFFWFYLGNRFFDLDRCRTCIRLCTCPWHLIFLRIKARTATGIDRQKPDAFTEERRQQWED